MKRIIWITWLLLSAAPSFAGEISRVTIRNKNFEIVKVIKDKVSLQLFEEIWKTKTKLKSTVTPQWLFKIDIEGKRYGDRWLYDPRGYVSVLSKARVLVYNIPAPDSFNQLIGTHNQAAGTDQ